jgi:cellulose synthase (UDP-forming)
MRRNQRKAKTPSNLYRKKRQFGTEKNISPLPSIHEQPSSGKIALSRFYIVLTIVFWVVYVLSVIMKQLIEGPKSYQFTLEAFGYLLVVTFLTFSALMYLVARQGALQRFSKHTRVPRALLERYFSTNQPSITVLVPSYSEEPDVIRKTLLSAALQEYPKIRIVLLLDDDVSKLRAESLEKFEKTKGVCQEIKLLLSEPYERFSRSLKKIENKKFSNRTQLNILMAEAAENYAWAAQWLENMATHEKSDDHVDIFFTEQVLKELAKDFKLVRDALVKSNEEGASLTKEVLLQMYRRLVWTFGAEIEVFERKKYVSLSHEPNKAMNLNSYIGLMGGSYNTVQTSEGAILVSTVQKEKADLVVPDSDFLLTLDADSILLRDYCLRLVYFLQQPDNADVAVTQTPYSAFRGAPTRIERLAGATTDVQHILHQGMSYYNATFWVGANAVIRKKALNDIEEKEWVGGFEVKRYVQDRTVIEDTESSIDIALHGWRLVNYPERLSYSATPPDFGSLVVQRRRWANGGLLILPKLFTNNKVKALQGIPNSKTEFMLRLNYMASIAWSNLGLVFLLAYPYDGRLLSPFVLLAAIPYFIAMASDLKYCRYSYSDIIRIYGFNLILLPVNIAGVFKSLQQALTTRKIPFARTPKIKDRTAAGFPYVISPLLIVAFSLFTLWRNIEGQNWGNAIFAGFNAFAASWAIVTYIGIVNMIVDIWLGIKNFLFVEVREQKASRAVSIKPTLDWKVVLYHGEQTGHVPYESLNDLVLQQRKESVI